MSVLIWDNQGGEQCKKNGYNHSFPNSRNSSILGLIPLAKIPGSLQGIREYGQYFTSKTVAALSQFIDAFLGLAQPCVTHPINQTQQAIELLHLENVSEKRFLRSCSHLCLGTGTNGAVFQTLGTQDINTHFSARVQGLDLVLGHGHHDRILGWVLEKPVCSH